MITNINTNKVLLGKGLCHPKYIDGVANLLNLLHSHDVVWDWLPHSDDPNHIWARDYMPVQVDKDRFVLFRYEPDYLKDSPEYKPDRESIIKSLGLNVDITDINLDRGNVISCGDKVIMTDKIFKENPHYTTSGLIDALTDLLESEIIIIPWDRYEEFGHADGMVRHIEGNRVLLNNYYDFDKPFRQKLIRALSPHFDIEELHYDSYSRYSCSDGKGTNFSGNDKGFNDFLCRIE